MEKGIAVVTGADGGMGSEITRAIAKAGFPVIMASYNRQNAEEVCRKIKQETGNQNIEIRDLNLTSFRSINAFAEQLLKEGRPIALLMNNAGILTTKIRKTEDDIETIVSVNYVGPYFLTRKLLPLLGKGSRIVNTVSCTYAIGKLDEEFLSKGKKGCFLRIPVYSNTKLALLLFTQELAGRIKERGITVNAADPGIVSTNMIKMDAWFDPLTDIFFRPFIRTPKQGAATAIHLALSDEVASLSGQCFASCKPLHLSNRILHHKQQKELRDKTEALLQGKGFTI